MVQVQNETHQFELVGNAESSGGEGRGEEAVVHITGHGSWKDTHERVQKLMRRT